MDAIPGTFRTKTTAKGGLSKADHSGKIPQQEVPDAVDVVESQQVVNGRLFHHKRT